MKVLEKEREKAYVAKSKPGRKEEAPLPLKCGKRYIKPSSEPWREKKKRISNDSGETSKKKERNR